MKNLFALLFTLSCAFVGYSQEWNYSAKQVKVDTSAGKFGWGLAKYNNQLLVGDIYESYDVNGQNYMYRSGAVYVLTEVANGSWQQIQKLTMNTRASNRYFGQRLLVKDSFLFVSAVYDNLDENDANSIPGAGAVHVYKVSSSGIWSYWQKIVAPDRLFNSFFGRTIKSNSLSIFIASYSPFDEQGQNYLDKAGKVYEFKLDSNGYWLIHAQITANTRYSGDRFGYSVFANDTILITSAPFHDFDQNEANPVSTAGAVYVFKLDSNLQWYQETKLVDTTRNYYDVLGINVHFSNNKIVVKKKFFNGYGKELIVFGGNSGSYNLEQRVVLQNTPNPVVLSISENDFITGMNNEIIVSQSENHWVASFKWLNDTLSYSQVFNLCGTDTSTMGTSCVNWNNKLIIGTPGDSLYPEYGSFVEFEYCTAPVLNGLTEDTISNCTGLAAISVDSSSSIGSGVAWGLYFGTTTDSLLATDSTGNFNIQLTEPGYYSISAIGSCNAMCNQIESFYFQFDPLYSSVQIVACDSEYVLNQWVTTSTTLYDTLSSVNGCDSIAVFDVTILNPTVTNEDVFGCDSLFFDGLWFNSNSTHSSTFVGMNGCDSVVNYSIYLQNTQHFFDTVYGFDSALVYGQWVYTYGWYDTVFTSAFGCDSIYHYWVELGANFGLLFNTTNEVFGADGMIDLMVIGGVGPYTYDWDNDGLGDADDTQDLSGLTAGTYSVIVVDKYGKVSSGSVDVGSSLSVSELLAQNLSIYPNPTTGQLTVSVDGQSIESMQLIGMLGELILTKSDINADKAEFNLGAIAVGNYFLKITTTEGTEYIQKVIKE